MKILSATSWKRKGSSIIFGQSEIQELLKEKGEVMLLILLELIKQAV